MDEPTEKCDVVGELSLSSPAAFGVGLEAHKMYGVRLRVTGLFVVKKSYQTIVARESGWLFGQKELSVFARCSCICICFCYVAWTFFAAHLHSLQLFGFKLRPYTLVQVSA